MIKLKIQGKSRIDATILYLETIENYYMEILTQQRTGSDEYLVNSAYLELVQMLLTKLRIKQIEARVKVSINLLKIQVLLLVKHNNMFQNDSFTAGLISDLTIELHNQLINQNNYTYATKSNDIQTGSRYLWR